MQSSLSLSLSFCVLWVCLFFPPPSDYVCYPSTYLRYIKADIATQRIPGTKVLVVRFAKAVEDLLTDYLVTIAMFGLCLSLCLFL